MNPLKSLGASALVAAALMALVGTSVASATTIEIGGITQNGAVTINITQAPGTSTILKDKNGTTNDTCTGSEIHMTTTPPFSAAVIHGVLSTRRYEGCTHTTDVLKAGKLSFAWASGTNATVTSSESEVTVKSTVFGISAVCKTGAGTHVGTITGVSSGHATFHTSASTMDCGALGTSSMTGTDIVTTPTGFGVEN